MEGEKNRFRKISNDFYLNNTSIILHYAQQFESLSDTQKENGCKNKKRELAFTENQPHPYRAFHNRDSFDFNSFSSR